MSRQLSLPLPLRDSFSRNDYIVTPATALALAAVEGWQLWPGGKMLLIGPRGAGKSHLAAIWAESAEARGLSGRDLATLDPAGFGAEDRVLVEDAEVLAGDRAAETALFHLHNIVTPRGRLLLTAGSPPRDWGIGLADLLSRLQATPVTRIEAPDDALLHGVLAKLFSDRQLAVPPALLDWLLPRMPRSIAAARRIVAELDSRALAEGRPPGQRLAAEVLEALAGDADEADEAEDGR